jgi:hypothetical protein
MTFFARPAPDRDAAALRSVRQALNTPVVAISELPIGPASAAIAVHDDAHEGSPHLTLAVRSERTRGVIFFGAREAAASAGPSPASDAVLSLAEGMGFLFDESWVDAAAQASASDAERVWEAFATGAHPSAPPPSVWGPERLLTKFRRALPWNPAQPGRSNDGSAAMAAADEPRGR